MAHKYYAQAIEVDGIRFASKKEARRYSELMLLWKVEKIAKLELQPRYLLGTDENPVLLRSARYPKGRRSSYLADFKYYDKESFSEVVEDVKGMDTPLSKLKRAVVEAQYGIRIVLV